MKRPKKKNRTNMKDYDLEKCIHVGYNECHDDFTAFLPSEEEWIKIITRVQESLSVCADHSCFESELAKAIHKRLA